MPYAETAAHGATVEIDVGTSTPDWDEIPGVHNGPRISRANEIIQARHHGSTSSIKKASFRDEGQCTFDIYYDSTDTVHTALRTAFEGKTTKSFRVTLTDNGAEIYTFSAVVSQFAVNAEVEGWNVASVALDISGDITVS